MMPWIFMCELPTTCLDRWQIEDHVGAEATSECRPRAGQITLVATRDLDFARATHKKSGW
jgi:hypothetical protein